MNILALDLSSRDTGYCYCLTNEYGDLTIQSGHLDTEKKHKGLRGVERLIQIRNEIKELVNVSNPNCIIIEGYAFGGSRGHDQGELGGVIRVTLKELGIRTLVIAPASLKRFVTGKGTAAKEVMLMKTLKRFGVEFDNNNECDARCLFEYGKELIKLGKEAFEKKYKIKFKKDIVEL